MYCTCCIINYLQHFVPDQDGVFYSNRCHVFVFDSLVSHWSKQNVNDVSIQAHVWFTQGGTHSLVILWHKALVEKDRLRLGAVLGGMVCLLPGGDGLC